MAPVLVLAQAPVQAPVQDSVQVPVRFGFWSRLLLIRLFWYALRLTCIETENKRNNQ